MASKYIVELVDDLTGEVIEDDAQTVEFTWVDGKRRRLDLTADNYDAMMEAMAPYVDAAQVLSKNGKPVKRTRPATGVKEIRAWARQNGYDVSPKGRIPADVREAYENAA